MGCERDVIPREPSARIRAKRPSVIDSEVEEEGDAAEDESEESEDSDDREFIDNEEVEEGDLHKDLHAQLSISERTNNLKGRLGSLQKARACKKDYFKYIHIPKEIAHHNGIQTDEEGADSEGPKPIKVEAPPPKKKKGKVTNKAKVHDPEYHPTTSLWSACHTKNKADQLKSRRRHGGVGVRCVWPHVGDWNGGKRKTISTCKRGSRRIVVPPKLTLMQ